MGVDVGVTGALIAIIALRRTHDHRQLGCRVAEPSPTTQIKEIRPSEDGRISLVGVTGLEPATSRPPAVRASQLRYTPGKLKAGRLRPI